MIDVVAAVIKNEKDEFLIALRSKEKDYGDFWEFPGGKVEKGETYQEALAREIKEELLVDVEVKDYLTSIKTFHNEKNYNIIAYFCEIKNNNFITLTEHQEAYFKSAEELFKYKMSPADDHIRKEIDKIF